MSGHAVRCKLCGGWNYHGGHTPECRETADSELCRHCGCARRAHAENGCLSHGCRAMLALWLADHPESPR